MGMLADSHPSDHLGTPPHANGAAAAGSTDHASGLPLQSHHLADLRKSGLSDEAIRAGGFYSAYGNKVRELLDWGSTKDGLGHCLAIPYRDAEGNPVLLLGGDGKPLVGSDGKPFVYTRMKPDKPRKERGGKNKGRVIKYESRIRARVLPCFPPSTLAALKDASQPLLITEGEKKAAKADQEGFPCIGLGGVDCWSKPRTKDKGGKAKGQRELIADLAAIPWQGRPVTIVYDSDLADTPK